MVIKELQILSEALWESVKTDLLFFSPIQSFVRKLADFNYGEINAEDTKEIVLCANKIEDFFKHHRPSEHGISFLEPIIDRNDETVKSILKLSYQLNHMSIDQLEKETDLIRTKTKKTSSAKGCIFIGHGRSKIWARVNIFLEDELHLQTLYFESESRTSESITSILNDFLDRSSCAIIIVTAEDETSKGKTRARQNVVHEVGLFQGSLGFNKVIILKQEGVEEFTNINGLQYIPFPKDAIEQTFYDLQRKLKKIGLIN